MCKFLFVIFKVSITKIIKVGFTHFLKHYPEILFNLIKMLKNWKTKNVSEKDAFFFCYAARLLSIFIFKTSLVFSIISFGKVILQK